MIWQNLLKITAASLVLSLGFISGGHVLAKTVTSDFQVKNLTGILAGQTFDGYIKYDDSFLTGQGYENITSSDQGLSFFFNFYGGPYDETNDPYNRTQVSFFNGKPKTIYFRGNYDTYPQIPYTFAFSSYSSQDGINFKFIDFSYLFDERPDLGIVGDSGEGKVVFFNSGTGDPISVPEPSSIIGICAMALYARHRRSQWG
ncbi:hypothetical protein NIES4075_03920 [Tolypothrix sp. NIES-4075]|uniref:PEP-CTERM sorting domain-containing protein n=1 Tax=Tolypothrix sp. NIES-4075 TaxID=2005459 RepID=UPI000B5C5074|nr:PEP-CTERM sorting domain-containing protein [Tolypothrix sp. NIES-4075]GAX39436.1 hypothetical protein NIES4075_03920 [Tolypothrix sp. NIES-4075]